MENPEVAQVFEEVAYLLEIQGGNPFRVRAYQNAARTIRDLSAPLAQMPPEELLKIPVCACDRPPHRPADRQAQGLRGGP